MLPWVTVDRARTTDGSELVLARRGHEFTIRLDGKVLMNSESNESEQQLAVHGCAGLRAVRGARVLIGGLGMGFTVRAALDGLAADAQVDVVELVSAVVRWNRDHLGHLAREPLHDRRVRVVEGDVADTIARTRGSYDAILLDVDNGPAAVTSSNKNSRLYALDGVRRVLRALRPGGTFALWSASEARHFTARLQEAGAEVDVKRVRAQARSNRRHVLWLARPTPG